MKYHKKPVVVEAIRIESDNFDEVKQFCPTVHHAHGWVALSGVDIVIPTLEGEHLAKIGDYIIRGVAGEYYPCKPDIFEKTYEPVEGVSHNAKG